MGLSLLPLGWREASCLHLGARGTHCKRQLPALSRWRWLRSLAPAVPLPPRAAPPAAPVCCCVRREAAFRFYLRNKSSFTPRFQLLCALTAGSDGRAPGGGGPGLQLPTCRGGAAPGRARSELPPGACTERLSSLRFPPRARPRPPGCGPTGPAQRGTRRGQCSAALGAAFRLPGVPGSRSVRGRGVRGDEPARSRSPVLARVGGHSWQREPPPPSSRPRSPGCSWAAAGPPPAARPPAAPASRCCTGGRRPGSGAASRAAVLGLRRAG